MAASTWRMWGTLEPVWAALGPMAASRPVEISKYARPSDPQVIASSPQPTCKQTSSQASVLYARVWLAVLSGLLAF